MALPNVGGFLYGCRQSRKKQKQNKEFCPNRDRRQGGEAGVVGAGGPPLKKTWVLVVLLALVSAWAARPVAAQQGDGPRIALLIGNSDYPDADAPLKQAVRDARALADELRRNGFDTDVAENLTK